MCFDFVVAIAAKRCIQSSIIHSIWLSFSIIFCIRLLFFFSFSFFISYSHCRVRSSSWALINIHNKHKDWLIHVYTLDWIQNKYNNNNDDHTHKHLDLIQILSANSKRIYKSFGWCINAAIAYARRWEKTFIWRNERCQENGLFFSYNATKKLLQRIVIFSAGISGGDGFDGLCSSFLTREDKFAKWVR